MTRFTFEKLIRVGVLVIGVILIFCLYSVDKTLDRNGKNSDGGRSILCLQMKALGQPVTEYPPCMRPSVYALWKDEPVKPVASHEMICEITAAIQRPIPECEARSGSR